MRKRTMKEIRKEGRRRGRPTSAVIDFNGDTFEKIADDMKSGRISLPRVTYVDPETPDLRVDILASGLTSFRAGYKVNGSRHYLTIGYYPDRSVEEARSLTQTIQHLGSLGIDPQDGLHDRLIKELLAQGKKWRPR